MALSWVLGFKRLGFEVFLLEQLDRAHCVPRSGTENVYAGCLNVDYFLDVVEAFGLSNSAALIGERGESLYGPSLDRLLELAGGTELLVNLSGNLRVDELKRRPKVRAYVDIDPGFAQLWLAAQKPAPRITGHDLYFTIGENVGTPYAQLPSGDIDWLHTRQPVLLEEWPAVPCADRYRFTTVGRWHGVGPHGPLETIGMEFSSKGEEIMHMIDLPRVAPLDFELALDAIDDAGRERLEAHRWTVIDPSAVAANPNSFRDYVQSSGGEFSIAKGVYVATSSGWFSDRTVRYLASGKPALVQDTGFSRVIPTGEGLVTFSTRLQAESGARLLATNYDRHVSAARRLAEEFFDSDKVLTSFLEQAMP